MAESAGKPAVLIVDDEPAACRMAREMFATFGHACYEARNGPEALRVLRSHPEIALLFSDVRMPGMSGHALAAEALAMRPGLGVLLTSGWAGEEPAGDLPFVPKPYRMRDLRSIVEAILKRSTAARSRRTGRPPEPAGHDDGTTRASVPAGGGGP